MSAELDNYLRSRDCTENILAIYGVLDARLTYVFPTFTMVKKDGEVKTWREDSSCGSNSELRRPTYSAMHVFDGSNSLSLSRNESRRLCNDGADFQSVWKDCSKPKNGAEKLHLDQWAEAYDVKVKWINSVTICAVCLTTIKLNDGSEFAKTILSDIRWGYKHSNAVELSNQLNAHAKDRYWYYGIHPECNPRNTATKSNLIRVLKPCATQQMLIDCGYSKPNECVDFIKTIADCWPGYAKIYKQIISKGTAVKIRQRAVRQWAKRNPGKASTESARSFFKLVFGISNLTKYTNDINTKQNRQNLRTAKSRNPMLARSR
jgi:hypothetical protein